MNVEFPLNTLSRDADALCEDTHKGASLTASLASLHRATWARCPLTSAPGGRVQNGTVFENTFTQGVLQHSGNCSPLLFVTIVDLFPCPIISQNSPRVCVRRSRHRVHRVRCCPQVQALPGASETGPLQGRRNCCVTKIINMSISSLNGELFRENLFISSVISGYLFVASF